MAKRSLLAGTTSHTEYVLITDMNGSAITGLLYNSSGLAAKYVLTRAASVAITLATQTVSGAWSSGGFVEVDATAMPGVYRFDIPDAAFGSGDKSVVSIYGYTGMSVTLLEYDMGVTVLLSSGTGTGQLDFTSGVVKSNLMQILGTALTETAGQIAGGFKKLFDVTSPVFTLLSINQTGDSYARIGAAGASLTALGDTRIANLDATVSSRTKPADTQAAVTLVTTTTNLTNAPTAGDLTATMKTSVTTAASAATPAVTVSDKTGFSLSGAGVQAIWDALTSALSTVNSIGKLLVTNIDAAISSRLATSGYTAPDNADILLIKAKTDNLPASPAATGGAMTLTAGERNSIAAALLDLANGVETGYTLRQSTRLMLAALAGKLSGADGTTVTIRDVNDTADRIVATVDSNGNRTAVVLTD